MAVQQGAKYLERTQGGRGILLGGVPAWHRNGAGSGGGVVGHPCRTDGMRLGAKVYLLDTNLEPSAASFRRSCRRIVSR